MQLTRPTAQLESVAGSSLAILDPSRSIAHAATTAAAMHNIRVVRMYHKAQSALEAIHQGNSPDVMLMCWQPPRREALEFCRAIRNRSSSPCPFLPLVMICNRATRESVLTARDAGVDEFLVSPFTSKSFSDRIKAVLFQRRGFVDVRGFFGPDRRRGAMAEMLGVDRRSGPTSLIDPETGAIYVE